MLVTDNAYPRFYGNSRWPDYPRYLVPSPGARPLYLPYVSIDVEEMSWSGLYDSEETLAKRRNLLPSGGRYHSQILEAYHAHYGQ